MRSTPNLPVGSRPELLELVACPVCHGDLRFVESQGGFSAACPRCRRAYGFVGPALDLIPFPPPDEDVAGGWALWEKLQRNGEVSYDEAPESNLSVGARRDSRAFGEFSGLEGLVLDVGCGPQEMPSYGAAFPGVFVGIDPLFGSRRRRFVFVRAVGEYLPFRDGTFDRVLFATSLDHVMSPERVLREACRVVKGEGSVCVWCCASLEPQEAQGPTLTRPSSFRDRLETAGAMLRRREFGPFGRRLAARLGLARDEGAAPRYLDRLDTPDGAIDRFHAFHIDAPTAEGLLEGAGLVTVQAERFGSSDAFLRARKRREETASPSSESGERA